MNVLDNQHLQDPYRAPYEGAYLVRKGGGIGPLDIWLTAPLRPNPACGQGDRDTDALDCRYEELGGGHSLRIEEFGPDGQDRIDGRRWGRYYEAILALGDGRAVLVADISGFTGEGEVGPGMAAPPLTKEQLRTFVLRPEMPAGLKPWGTPTG
ncbi:hypothetical protein ABT095_32890 [Kitasatospora sp. NPDC002227]|uniref:hypothetical protein n=1 Tax=Kitasatospora sp. NPDC002227 TaxID=3154773 RepID=UPI003333952E